MEYELVRKVAGLKWTLEILDELAEKSPQNYSSIEATLSTSSDIVSDRLVLLTEYGLVERHERSRKDVQYSITDSGRSFLNTARELDSYLQKTGNYE